MFSRLFLLNICFGIMLWFGLIAGNGLFCGVGPSLIIFQSLSKPFLLEFYNNRSTSISIYTLKGFVVCFQIFLFIDYDSVVFPSQILLSQVFLFKIVSTSFLESFSSVPVGSNHGNLVPCPRLWLGVSQTRQNTATCPG